MKKKKKISTSLNPEEKNFRRDLEKFSNDCEKILSTEELSESKDFLEQFAEDIKKLSEDASLIEESNQFQEAAHIVNHILKTPWGAPFVSNKTFIEAALAYRYQDPLNSDLHELITQFNFYSEHDHNPLLMVVHSLAEHLQEEPPVEQDN